MGLNKNLVRVIKLVISILALVVLFSLISVDDFYLTLTTFNYIFVIALIFFILFNVFLYVLAYRFLLKKPIPLKETFGDYMVAWSFGLFLPGKLGELGIIPVLKKKYNIPYKFSGTAVILPKLFLLLVLLVFAIAFGATLISLQFLVLFAFIVILFLAIVLSFWAAITTSLKKYKIFADLLNNKKKIFEMLSPKNLVMLIIISLARFGVIIIMTLVAYWGFGVNVPIVAITLGVAVGQIVSFIPVTLNGLGAREASFSGVMALYGVPMAATIGAVSITLILNYGLGIAIILLWNLLPFSKKN